MIELIKIKRSEVCPLCKKYKRAGSMRCVKCYHSKINAKLSTLKSGSRRIRWLKK